MSPQFRLSLIMLLAASSGFASIGERFVPAAGVATLTGSWALWQNPAGLAFLEGSESTLAYLYEWDQPGNSHHGTGNLAMNLWNFLTLSGGVKSQIAPSFEGGTNLRGIAGIGLRLSEKSSLGLSFMKSHNFSLAKSSGTMVSFGLQTRITSYLALGAWYQEIHDGYFKAPNMLFGLGLRPLKELFTLSLDGRLAPMGKKFSDGFRLDPIFGLKTQWAGFGLSVGAEIPGLRHGWNKPIFSLGLDLNFAHWGISLASSINAANANYGLGTSLRASTAEWESLYKPSDFWVELDIDAQGSLEGRRPGFARQLFTTEISPLFILSMLKRLARDPQIAGVIIHINGFSFGDGRAQEWRDALLALRNANKQVVVYLDDPSERDYYVATAATKIYMNKQATLSLQRFQTTLVYLADLLAKIGVKAEAITAGNYKTATRPFTNAHPQKEEIEVYTNILNDFYDNLLEETSKARTISREELRQIFDQGEINAHDAQRLGLIDEAIFQDEIRARLEKPSEPLKLFPNYSDRLIYHDRWEPAKKIVVIPIEGEICDGHVYPSLFSFFGLKTGALDVVDEINQALTDPRVAGIILRINSPGGLSSAGEKIQRAVVQAQEQKPIVTSMADVAASAGYLIATGSNHIIAERNTLTGSIGVFALHFSGEKLAQKIGVNATELSPIQVPGPTNFRPMTSAEKAQAQKIVDWSYQNFITAVATGLELPEALVKESADGRVWLGHEAFTRKLVQEIGGFAQAIDALRLLIEIPEPEELILEIRNPGGGEMFSLGSRLASFFGGQSELKQLGDFGHLAQPYIKAIDCYRLEGVPQARLPFNIAWD